jgi:uncharacterized protein YcaQ
MSVHQLTRRDARRIAVRAQLLTSDRPAGLFDVVRGLNLLQLDQTAYLAPNADLIAWSRLGSSYNASELADAIATQALVELRGFVRPAEDLALFRAEMAVWPDNGRKHVGKRLEWQEYQRGWVEANEGCRLDILERLRQDGPLVMRALPDTCRVPWQSSGWTNNRNVPKLLEFMMQRGEVAISGREGRDRLWDLARRVYPDDPVVPVDEARRILDAQRLRSLGLLRAKGPECPDEPQDAGAAGEPAVVEGVKGEWRVDPSLLGQPFSGRTALLSPLDRLVYDRKRLTELFEFDYQLEMYKPAAKRRWGYFALPILHGDRLVGKADVESDCAAGVLKVYAIHEDAPFPKSLTAAVQRELRDLARWLRLEVVGARH